MQLVLCLVADVLATAAPPRPPFLYAGAALADLVLVCGLALAVLELGETFGWFGWPERPPWAQIGWPVLYLLCFLV